MYRNHYQFAARRIRVALPMTVAIFLALDGRALGGLIVSDWALQNRVSVIANGTNTSNDSSYFSGSPAPIMTTRNSAVGDNISFMTYSFAWDGDTGNFRIDGIQSAGDATASDVESSASGNINFSTNVDSAVALRLRYDYALPNGFMDGHGTVSLYDENAGVLYGQFSYGGFSLGPVIGNFDKTAYVIIPAGCNCTLSYSMRLIVRDPLNVPATDNGTIELSITPLPEPTLVLPLALGAWMLHRRKIRATTCCILP